MLRKNKLIIFDFDGVIVNSCQLSVDINREWYSDLTLTELQTWAEGNIYNQKLRDDFSDNYVQLYFERYNERIKSLIPVEGMENVFKKLNLEGYKLVIVSSADEEAIENYLQVHNLEKYFVEILARKTHASKVEKFKMIFKKYKIKAKETLMVTDSVGDVKEAHEVKMKAIGVIWGLHEKERLNNNGVDFIAERPEEILVGVKKILG